MRVAAVDIGTNTVLLLVAERREGHLFPVEEHATITRLGQNVDKTRVLAPDAVERTLNCLDSYAKIVDRLGVSLVGVVATSAMRDARGGEGIRSHVKLRFGVEAKTISGDEEAMLTFGGALSGLSVPAGEVAVFDVGGGSTEVVDGDGNSRSISFARSFDVGSVRLTERYIHHDPPTADELEALAAAATCAFEAIPGSARGKPVIGIAGTVTTLAALSLGLVTYDSATVHGHTLAVAEVEDLVARLSVLSLAERQGLSGMEPKRADVIIAGGMIVLTLLRRLGAASLTVSDRGVRWGVAEQLAWPAGGR